ncbi:unnamed protein product [Protopolystoma xenopodis]|uniref:Origin recognition complex subunit 1 n=1 Tax=Protopolystoma xenopodis TaxID=117903 RepID=A0A448XDY7_9PLAT|nr:unnamed protein product [Protopolystoma xenopodis]
MLYFLFPPILLQQLFCKKLPPRQAAEALELEFCVASKPVARKHKESYPHSSSPLAPSCLLIIDELDLLCSRRQDVLYSLFDWPTRPRGRRSLVCLAIANTMDLPERMLHHRVASRLGLTRLPFVPYSHEQLASIVRVRLLASKTANLSFQVIF